MNDAERHYYRQEFELAFHRERGKAFEALFARIMSSAFPGDFQAIQPYGSAGDLKCDGYRLSDQTVFQCYAPDRIVASRTIAKIKEDFTGALRSWPDRMKRWTFVYNTHADALPAEVLKTLLDLSAAHPAIEIARIGFVELQDIVMGLSSLKMALLFGPAPRASDSFPADGEMRPDPSLLAHQRSTANRLPHHPDVDALPRVLEDELLDAVAKPNAARTGLAAIEMKLDRLVSSFASFQLPALPDAEARDHAELDRIRGLLNGRQPKAALIIIGAKAAALDASASNAVRSRLKALAAHCHWHLGETETAAGLFQQAATLAPTDRRGVAAAVLVEIVRENYADALAIATEAMRRDPENDVVAPWLLLAAARVPGTDDPSCLVAPVVREKAEFCEAYVDFLRSRNDREDWWAFARTKAREHPDSELLQIAAADSELDEFVETTDYRSTGRVPEDWRRRIAAAAKVHRAQLDEIDRSDAPANPVVPGLAANLAGMLGILARPLEAADVLWRALRHFPDDIDLVSRGAQAALAIRHDELERHCVPRLQATPQDLLLKVQFLARRAGWGALAALDGDGALQRIEGADGDLARLIARVAAIRLSAPEKRREALTALIDASATDPVLIVAAEAAQSLGFHDLAGRTYDRAVQATDDSAHIVTKLNVASVAEAREDWQTVIRLLDGQIDTAMDTPALRMLARAHANADLANARTVAFFAGLPDDVRTSSPFVEMAAFVHLKIGDPAGALPLLDRAVTLRPHNARVLSWRWRALGQLGRESEFDAVIQGLDPKLLEGAPQDLLTVSHAMARFGRGSDAIAFAYSVLLTTRDDPEVELLYCGLFLGFSDASDRAWLSTTIVADGTWLRIVDQHGQADEFLIDSTAPPGRDIVAPQDGRARRFVGLAVGATVTDQAGTPMERRRTIVEIKHRFVHMLHEILRTFNDRFPGHHGLQQLTMRDGNVEPVLELVRARARGAEETARLYEATSTPLDAIARATGASTIDFMEYLESRQFGIRVCLGTSEELKAADAAVRASCGGSGVVLDITALWTAMRLGLLPDLKRIFGRVIAAKSVLDVLKHWREEQASRHGKQGGIIAAVGDSFQMIPFDDASVERVLAEFDAMIASVEANVESVPAVAPDGLPEKWIHILSEDRQRTFADSAHVAMQSGAFLVAEDLGYRSLASSIGVGRSSWLQAVLTFAVAERLIDAERYADLVSRLAMLRHGHLSLQAAVLQLIAKRHPERFKSVAYYVGGPDADLRSHVQVVATFCEAALRSGQPSLRRCMSHLLHRLVASRPHVRESLLVAVVGLSADPPTTLQYVREWCATRGLPSRGIGRRIMRIQKRARRQRQTP